MRDIHQDIERLDLLYDLEKYSDAVHASTVILETLLESKEEVEGDLYKRVLQKRGASFDALERYSEALEVYDFLIRADSDDSHAWRNRAYSLSMLERNEEALEAYNRVLELETEADVDTYTQRGMILDDLGRHEEAVLSYDQSLFLEPDYENVWEMRGDSLCLSGRFEEATISYLRSLDIEPLGAGVWIKLAQIWNQDKEEMKALEAYTKALESCEHLLRNEDNPHTWLWNAKALQGLGLTEESKASASKAAELFEEMRLQEAASECRQEAGKLHEPAWHKTRNGIFTEVPKPINQMNDEELKQFAIKFLEALKVKR